MFAASASAVGAPRLVIFCDFMSAPLWKAAAPETSNPPVTLSAEAMSTAPDTESVLWSVVAPDTLSAPFMVAVSDTCIVEANAA